MGTLYRWGYESQPSGTTVTAANSDDNGDPAFGAVSVTGPTPVLRYSNLHPASGLTGLEVGGAVGDVSLYRSPTFTADTNGSVQEDWYLTALPTVNVIVYQFRFSGTLFSVILDTLGRLFLQDNTGSSPSTLLRLDAMSLNTAYRYDARAIVGSTTSNGQFKQRLRQGSTVIDEQTSSALNLSTGAVLTSVQGGKPNSGGAITGMFRDNFAVQSGLADYIPDAVSNITGTLTLAPTSGTVPISTTATATVTGGNGNPYAYTFVWGDGATTGPQSGNTATHTYSSSGVVDVTCLVVNT